MASDFGNVRKSVESFHTKYVRVKVEDIKSIRHFLQLSGDRVHSNGAMHVDDKKIVLGNLRKAKTLLDGILQLDLFSDAQLK